MYMLLVILISVESFKAPLKKGGVKKNKLLKKGGVNVLKVMGETGVGVVSLSVALAILNSLEADTDPSDKEMLTLIGKERERLMSLSSSSWVSPVAWGGSATGIAVLVTFVCIFRIIRKKKSRQGERKEVKMVSVSTIKENDAPSGIQFGEVQFSAGAPERIEI